MTASASPALAVGIAGVLAAVAGEDDVAVLQADPGVVPWAEVGVTPVAGEAEQLPGQRQTVALGDPPGAADVPARPLVVALARGLPGQLV